MNVLFLDIDGVLVSHRSMAQEVPTLGVRNEAFSVEAVNTLIEIIRQYNFLVVLSSSWRLHKMDYTIIEELLEKYSIEIHDRTPDFHVYSESKLQRNDEIAQWLSENPEVEKFIILDDDIMGELSPFHIKTTWYAGLLPEHKEQINIIMEK